jgi:N utilization substance protein B
MTETAHVPNKQDAQESSTKESDPKRPRPAKRKSSRRRAREFAVQGLFQWQLNQETGQGIALFLKESSPYFVKADQSLFQAIFFGCLREMSVLQAQLIPHLDRPEAEVSPVEKAILFTAAYELMYMPETPYAVVLNEAIELAKTFGGTDGHKFVNGILDKIAVEVRTVEAKMSRDKHKNG